jgi:hypothetical protein
MFLEYLTTIMWVAVINKEHNIKCILIIYYDYNKIYNKYEILNNKRTSFGKKL